MRWTPIKIVAVKLILKVENQQFTMLLLSFISMTSQRLHHILVYIAQLQEYVLNSAFSSYITSNSHTHTQTTHHQ